MIERFKEMKYSHAYNFAGFIREKIFRNNEEDYLSDYFDVDDLNFRKKLLKPQKKTVLHDFLHIEFDLDIEYNSRKVDPIVLFDEWEELLIDYNINIIKKERFTSEKDYLNYLGKKIKENISSRVTDEIFQVLFGDRMFCLKFNEIISEEIIELKVVDYPKLLASDGKIKRCNYFQSWVQRAVFIRDKGCCAICLKDLSGLLKTNHKKAIDHIVPLKLGGTNDITNLQLICEGCNLKKHDSIIKTSESYSTYF